VRADGQGDAIFALAHIAADGTTNCIVMIGAFDPIEAGPNADYFPDAAGFCHSNGSRHAFMA
jgi:hypothetical protein